jgi:hypothetical protein
MVGVVLGVPPVFTAYFDVWFVGMAGFGFALLGLWWYLRYVDTKAEERSRRQPRPQAV